MHPTAHVAAFDELSGWLAKFSDLPVADRIFALASKRKTDPTADAPQPAADLALRRPARPPIRRSRRRPAAAARPSTPATRAGRSSWPPPSGDRWIAGLAAYRLKAYDEARENFADLARDGECDAWMQSAAGLWAARTAEAQSDAAGSARFLRAAARNSETFYGMVAARQLKLANRALAEAADDPVAKLLLAAYSAPGPPRRPSTSPASSPPTPRAHRAAALAQIGRGSDAIQELRAGMALARTPADAASAGRR